MKKKQIHFCCQPSWLMQAIVIVSFLLQFNLAQARIGERREQMIQRLGPPKYEGDTYCAYSMDEIRLSVRFHDGICVQMEYGIDRLNARGKERVERINSMLMDASGGVAWSIVNLSGAGVKWETEDKKLKALLLIQDENMLNQEIGKSWDFECLTVTSIRFERSEAARVQAAIEKESKDFRHRLNRIIIIVFLCACIFFLWKKYKIASFVIGLLAISFNPWVPMGRVPLVFGMLIGGIVFIFVMLGISGYVLMKRGKL